MKDHVIEKEYKINFTKKSKYERVSGWDDSEGFLTSKQIDFLIEDEKNMANLENKDINNIYKEFIKH